MLDSKKKIESLLKLRVIEKEKAHTIFSKTANCFKAKSEPSDFNCSKICSTLSVLIENKRLINGNSF